MTASGSGIVGGLPGLDGLLGVHFVSGTGSRVELALDVRPEVHQDGAVLATGEVRLATRAEGPPRRVLGEG